MITTYDIFIAHIHSIVKQIQCAACLHGIGTFCTKSKLLLMLLNLERHNYKSHIKASTVTRQVHKHPSGYIYEQRLT